MRNKEELFFLIDRAIESARCRIYRVKANIGESYAHQVKAENQNELMGITIKALQSYKKQLEQEGGMMGQHKYNQTAIDAKAGKLPPTPKKMSKRERDRLLYAKIQEVIEKSLIGGKP